MDTLYNKILIANRGEIAVRIVRACKEMGIGTAVAHSTVDRDTLAVKLADEAICIGEADSKKSYLNIPSIISAAEMSGSEAIHPGYGFLSENADFVEKCVSSGIDFIGPNENAIQQMGDKIQGRQLAEQAGVPTVPGTTDAVRSDKEAKSIAQQIGFPIMIKATAGGGGRGMRIVHSIGSLSKAYDLARSEADASFGTPDVFIEKFIESPRHVEVQILGDKHGNIVHLGDRDCSIQRKNQKILEEAPAPFLKPEIRAKMTEAAVRLAKQIKYFSLGTVEFLLAPDDQFYFLEMNTRLQVEHPVTEWICGKDLVKEQIRVACGQKLGYDQASIRFEGHAIECRINAEHPETFRPSPGKITAYHAPGGLGVRIDSFAHQGCVVSPYYDSLVSKLICYGREREEAIMRTRRALDEYVIEGIDTSILLLDRILASLRYQQGELSTSFLKNFVKIS